MIRTIILILGLTVITVSQVFALTDPVRTSKTCRGTLIAYSGDIRSILGPQGKNIVVCGHGDNIAVVYGDPATDPFSNSMELKVVLSIDTGTTWISYGPFSPEVRRLYPGIDGTSDFCTNPGELYILWQESPSGYATGDLKCMVEENLPGAPSFSSPVSLQGADLLTPWFGSIAVNPDNPLNVIITGWSYLNSGDRKNILLVDL